MGLNRSTGRSPSSDVAIDSPAGLPECGLVDLLGVSKPDGYECCSVSTASTPPAAEEALSG